LVGSENGSGMLLTVATGVTTVGFMIHGTQATGTLHERLIGESLVLILSVLSDLQDYKEFLIMSRATPSTVKKLSDSRNGDKREFSEGWG
jgi:hypothetical protein